MHIYIYIISLSLHLTISYSHTMIIILMSLQLIIILGVIQLLETGNILGAKQLFKKILLVHQSHITVRALSTERLSLLGAFVNHHMYHPFDASNQKFLHAKNSFHNFLWLVEIFQPDLYFNPHFSRFPIFRKFVQ